MATWTANCHTDWPTDRIGNRRGAPATEPRPARRRKRGGGS